MLRSTHSKGSLATIAGCGVRNHSFFERTFATQSNHNNSAAAYFRSTCNFFPPIQFVSFLRIFFLPPVLSNGRYVPNRWKDEILRFISIFQWLGYLACICNFNTFFVLMEYLRARQYFVELTHTLARSKNTAGTKKNVEFRSNYYAFAHFKCIRSDPHTRTAWERLMEKTRENPFNDREMIKMQQAPHLEFKIYQQMRRKKK